MAKVIVRKKRKYRRRKITNNEIIDGQVRLNDMRRLGSTYGAVNTEPAPPMTDPKYKEKAQQIIIYQLDYGYKVDVGCQSFAVTSMHKLLINLTKYLKEPQAVREAWFGGKLDI